MIALGCTAVYDELFSWKESQSVFRFLCCKPQVLIDILDLVVFIFVAIISYEEQQGRESVLEMMNLFFNRFSQVIISNYL